MSMKTDPIWLSLRTAVHGRLRQAAALSISESAEAAWAALAGLGAPALDAPLSADGMALGLAASTAVAEELGRFALPGRYLSVAFAIDVATASATAADLVRDLVAGDLTVRLSGFGGPPDDVGDVELALVAGGLSLDDGRGGAVRCPLDDSGLPEGPLGRARIRQAAYLHGLARGALVCGVQYAGQRRQFGRTLREFQSVAFRLAELSMEVEALRLMVARAAWLADGEHPYGRAAAETLGMAAEVAARTTQVVLQVCGVRGMTEELRVHRHYLRVRDEARRLGPARALWRELGRDRLAAV